MRLFSIQISVLVSLLNCLSVYSQSYKLEVQTYDKDPATVVSQLNIQTSFPSRFICTEYIRQLPGLLQAKGYVTASIDSVQYDSSSARIVLFTGELYKWARIDASKVEPSLLDAVGWRERIFSERPIDFVQVKLWQERLLSRLENTGYPFARVYLDSVNL